MDSEITGAVVSRRKLGDRIAIWNKSKDNENAIMGVGYASYIVYTIHCYIVEERI